MPKFFDFYDPLEKRYLFNSFLVVVALVEVLILVFTLIWQMDEGLLSGQVKVVPFPWKAYLMASFTAPLVLLFLFGAIVQGFEYLARETAPGQGPREGKGRRWLLLLWPLLLLGGLTLYLRGAAVLAQVTAGIKALGLGGTYLLIALMALALLYLPLRLLLRYRLQKKAMEYQYLLTLAERHGLVLPNPQDPAAARLARSDLPELPSESQKTP
jgi:hypothetical protein